MPVLRSVELNPVHVEISRRWFGLGGSRRDLVFNVADARDFIKTYRGPKFDLVVEDLYLKRDGEANRAITMDKKWMSTLRRHLARGGMLVSNFSDRREFRQSVPLAQWAGIYTMTLPAYENVIGIYVRRCELMTDIDAILKARAAVDKRISAKGLKFALKQVQ